MQHLDSAAAQAVLANITHLYTDLDGTLLAPGGKLLATHQGNPSTQLAEALVQLKQVGVETIIVTGRDAVSSTEIMRLANLERFIAEMGCISQSGYGDRAQKSFILGDWEEQYANQDYNHVADITPYEMIERSGIFDMLFSHFKGKLEKHLFKGSPREVTYPLRGNVDVTPGGELDQMLSEFYLPLQLLDNGIIHPKKHGLLSVDEIHVYHLMPRGTSKGVAVAADMTAHNLSPKNTLALGDAQGDLSMGTATGSFVLFNNRHDASLDACAEAVVTHPKHLFKTTRPTIDGWVEFAHALLAAKAEAHKQA